MSQLNTPFYCDRCSSLALAEIENEILCTNCLLAKVNKNKEATNALIEQITPLDPIDTEFLPPMAC